MLTVSIVANCCPDISEKLNSCRCGLLGVFWWKHIQECNANIYLLLHFLLCIVICYNSHQIIFIDVITISSYYIIIIVIIIIIM